MAEEAEAAHARIGDQQRDERDNQDQPDLKREVKTADRFDRDEQAERERERHRRHPERERPGREERGAPRRGPRARVTGVRRLPGTNIRCVERHDGEASDAPDHRPIVCIAAIYNISSKTKL